MLDIDREHQYYESSGGNGHLIVNTDLSHEAIVEILTVLNKHGIIQDGYLNSTKDRGFSALRPPGVQKFNESHDAWFYDEDIKSYPEGKVEKTSSAF